MSLDRRITDLEDDTEEHAEPVPAVILSDGRIMHRGREITAEELEELPTSSRGIRAVNFRPPDAGDALPDSD